MASFNWVRITPPGGQDATGASVSTNIIYEATCPVDPDEPGSRLVPKLSELRQDGSTLIRDFTNVDVVRDSAGNIADTSLLTGGFHALRQFTQVSGERTYDNNLIPCAVSWAGGHGPTLNDLVVNNNKVMLQLDPRPNGSLTAGFDPNKGAADLLAQTMPTESVSVTVTPDPD